jgi:hypothetical protein
MKQDVKYQELSDEQLERVVGGQDITRSFNVAQANLNATRQTAVAIAFGGDATAANLNFTAQTNKAFTAS